MCNKLYRLIYVLKLHVSQQLLKVIESVSNVFGQMQQNPLILTNVDPPRPLFNVVCHCSSSLMSIGIRIEKTTLIGEGGGGGVRYYV